MGFVRQVKTECGEWEYIDLFELADQQQRGKKMKRRKRWQPSSNKQKQANRKRAEKYFTQKLEANFDEDDFFVTYTFASWARPKTEDDLKRIARNYKRRVNRRLKKAGLPSMKWQGSFEHGTNPDGTIRNIHIHAVVSCDLGRDILEDCWRAPRIKGEKKGRKLGRVNASRVQLDENGFAGLAKYMLKQKGAINQHAWFCSQGLKEPKVTKSDYACTHRDLEQLAQQTDCPIAWENRFPGFTFVEADSTFHEEGGWHVSVKLRRNAYVPRKTKKNAPHRKKTQRAKRGSP